MRPTPASLRGRRAALASLGGALLLPPLGARAAGFVDRPVRLIVPYSGGVTDHLARQLSRQLAAQIGEPVVVDVRAGAGGLIGSRLAAQAPADGHTLLLGTSALAIGAAYQPQADFDPERDLTPIANVLTVPYVLVVAANSPQHTLADLGARGGKADATPLRFGSPGPSSGPHLVGELLKVAAPLNARHIPYNGGAAQITALLSGEIDFAFMSLVTALPQVQQGTLRALAVTSAEPAGSLPGVPPLRSRYAAIPEIHTWFALFGPKGLSAPWRDGWAQQIRSATASPEFVAQRTSWGADAARGAHTELAQQLANERARWAQLIADAGLKG